MLPIRPPPSPTAPQEPRDTDNDTDTGVDSESDSDVSERVLVEQELDVDDIFAAPAADDGEREAAILALAAIPGLEEEVLEDQKEVLDLEDDIVFQPQSSPPSAWAFLSTAVQWVLTRITASMLCILWLFKHGPGLLRLYLHCCRVYYRHYGLRFGVFSRTRLVRGPIVELFETIEYRAVQSQQRRRVSRFIWSLAVSVAWWYSLYHSEVHITLYNALYGPFPLTANRSASPVFDWRSADSAAAVRWRRWIQLDIPPEQTATAPFAYKFDAHSDALLHVDYRYYDPINSSTTTHQLDRMPGSVSGVAQAVKRGWWIVKSPTVKSSVHSNPIPIQWQALSTAKLKLLLNKADVVFERHRLDWKTSAHRRDWMASRTAAIEKTELIAPLVSLYKLDAEIMNRYVLPAAGVVVGYVSLNTTETVWINHKPRVREVGVFLDATCRVETTSLIIQLLLLTWLTVRALYYICLYLSSWFWYYCLRIPGTNISHRQLLNQLEMQRPGRTVALASPPSLLHQPDLLRLLYEIDSDLVAAGAEMTTDGMLYVTQHRVVVLYTETLESRHYGYDVAALLPPLLCKIVSLSQVAHISPAGVVVRPTADVGPGHRLDWPIPFDVKENYSSLLEHGWEAQIKRMFTNRTLHGANDLDEHVRDELANRFSQWLWERVSLRDPAFATRSALARLEQEWLQRRLLDALLQPHRVKAAAPLMIQQILNSARPFVIPRGDEAGNLPDEVMKCTICQEELVADESVCKWPCPALHPFHAHCIEQWLAQNHTCPLCRNEVAMADEDAQPTGNAEPLFSPRGLGNAVRRHFLW